MICPKHTSRQKLSCKQYSTIFSTVTLRRCNNLVHIPVGSSKGGAVADTGLHVALEEGLFTCAADKRQNIKNKTKIHKNQC